MYTDTHTESCQCTCGPLSGTTQVSQYQKGKNQSGFYWSKRQWVAVASAGPYASLHLAPGRKPCQNPTAQFFTGRMPFLPPNQQCQSTEGSSYCTQNKLFWKLWCADSLQFDTLHLMSFVVIGCSIISWLRGFCYSWKCWEFFMWDTVYCQNSMTVALVAT